MYVMEVNIRPSLRTKYATTTQTKNVDPATTTKAERMLAAQRNEAILKEMWFMVAFGLSIFLGGFGLWALDVSILTENSLIRPSCT